jgi:hypothetical protein
MNYSKIKYALRWIWKPCVCMCLACCCNRLNLHIFAIFLLFTLVVQFIDVRAAVKMRQHKNPKFYYCTHCICDSKKKEDECQVEYGTIIDINPPWAGKKLVIKNSSLFQVKLGIFFFFGIWNYFKIFYYIRIFCTTHA